MKHVHTCPYTKDYTLSFNCKSHKFLMKRKIKNSQAWPYTELFTENKLAFLFIRYHATMNNILFLLNMLFILKISVPRF